jgi:hypothetical protein
MLTKSSFQKKNKEKKNSPKKYLKPLKAESVKPLLSVSQNLEESRAVKA